MGYKFSEELTLNAKKVKSGDDLGPFMQRYFQNLEKLDQTINPIMILVHKEAGLTWRGRDEAAGLIKERPMTPKNPGGSGLQNSSTTCSLLDGDLD